MTSARWAWIAAVVALLVLALPAAYLLLTGYALQNITVRTVEIGCTGTDVRPDGRIEAQAGMECLHTAVISNSGGRDVHLDHLVLRFLGPDGGSVVRSDGIDGYQSMGSSDGLDLTVVLDQTLLAGASLELDIPVLFRQRGCSGRGTDVGFGEFPTVTVSYLGRGRRVSGETPLEFTQVGPSRGCREAD